MKLANAQVIAIFVAEQMASGALSYVGSRGAASFMGEDKDQNITPGQLSDIVGQIVSEQTKQLEATMREIDRGSQLFAYRKNLEDGLNAMQSLLRNYNTRGSSDTRMERIRSILDYAASVEGAFNTFFYSETLKTNYPELFFTYYATYSRFVETFIVIKAEEQIVNNIMAAEGIKGFKEVDNYEVAKAASDKLAMIHKFWYQGYTGHSHWINRFDDNKAGKWVMSNPGTWLNTYKQDVCFDRYGRWDGSHEDCNVDNPQFRKIAQNCLWSNNLLNQNGTRRKRTPLATFWGPDKHNNRNTVQLMNRSLAHTMDTRKEPRVYEPFPHPDFVCNGDFSYYSMGGEFTWTSNNERNESWKKYYFKHSIQTNSLKLGDWTGQDADRKEYALFNYYRAKSDQGIIEQPNFKAFLEPYRPVKQVGYPPVGRRGPWNNLDPWQFSLGHLPDLYVYSYPSETSSEKIRDCQILAAFGLYDEYLQHLTGVDFKNITFILNLLDFVRIYNDGKSNLVNDAKGSVRLLFNQSKNRSCRDGMVSK
ncbi:hypothetical protein N9E16_00200 [Planktomarina temperata]|nr:hypothetical protein [bacterium]MDA9971631.1 hypothetical protein [Planktomarina temperata]